MSILVNRDTKVITQGIAGANGLFHAHCARDYGTQMVGGVAPGQGGRRIEGFPVFDTVEQAVQTTGAVASAISVPPVAVADAIMEAVDAGIELVICITEGVPVPDVVKVRRYVAGKKARLVGPNCLGVITPGECKIGIMPGYIHKPGRVGIVSRSGPLTYEAAWQLTLLGIGQSTCVGLGNDPGDGSSFVDMLELFENDPGTGAVVMLGAAGGTAEVEAARFVMKRMRKPVAAYVARRTAPCGERPGHAGEGRPDDGAEEKIDFFRACGISVADTPAELAEALLAVYEPE